MKKKINLKRLVEQKVDEAWYNNKGDFARGLGKLALGTAATIGGVYAADRGLENDYQRNHTINQQSAEMSKPSEKDFQDWCNVHQLDPNNPSSLDQYNDWNEEALQESAIRRMVEKMVRGALEENLRKRA